MAEHTVSGKTLLDVCEFIVDCEHKTASIQATGYPSIRTPNVGKGRLILDDVNRVSEETYSSWTRRAVPKGGDLILAREAPAGNVALVPESLKVCLGQRTVLLRPDKSQVDPNYLLYLLLDDTLQQRLLSFGSGATVPHVNMSDIRSLALPDLPPIGRQHVIGDILSAYDDLIENNTRRIKILEEMAQMLYREWFVNFRFPGHEHVRMVESAIGMVPEGWEVKRLSDVCDITMGQSPSSEFYNNRGEGLPFHQGVTNFGKRFPVDRMYCTQENRIAKAGDILFSVRAPVGRINISTKTIVIGRGLCAIRSTSSTQRFIFQQLKERFKEEDSIGGGTIFKAVTKDDMYGIKLVIPTLDITLQFEQFLAPMYRQLEILTTKNINLRQTRDLLLHRLISGVMSHAMAGVPNM